MDVESYARQLKALLPSGPAWNLEPSSLISRLCLGIAEELNRVHARALALIDETDPRTALETLDDWERFLGLPSPCVDVGTQTTSQRRAAIVSKLTALGGQSPAYFISVAAALGITITITEFAVPYQWTINAPIAGFRELTCDDDCDEPFSWWGNTSLECVFNEIKPAHTHLIFAYT